MPPFRIELRSDTQTTPTQEMRAAMAQAVVGDDLAGEDPTVRELEDLAAEIFRKDAALFVTSGTMGNLVSLLTLSRRGDTLLVDPESHVTLAEAGGFAALAGCSVIPDPNPWMAHPRRHRAPHRTRNLPLAQPGDHLDRKHPQPTRGRGVGPRRHAQARVTGRPARTAAAYRRCPYLQRGSGSGRFGGGPGGWRRHRAVLPVKGPWRALRFDDRGIKRTDPAGTPNPPTRWRWYATGGRHGGGGRHCSEGRARAACGRSPPCQAARRRDR